MASSWGKQLTITLFGESHGPSIGVVLTGLPAGERLDVAEAQEFMKRRAPGRMPWSTSRREGDRFSVLSGLYQGQTTGTPLCAIIENEDARSQDYGKRTTLLRPSHADFSGNARYQGANDPRGGGHFSGRLTAPLCFAGAVCKQILARQGISVYARIAQIGSVYDQEVDLASPDLARFQELPNKKIPVLDELKGEEMVAQVEQARNAGDSVGGLIQCFALGVPAGIGDPIFGGVESKVASILYGIPAVKGVSFGAGFEVAGRTGSENNDTFFLTEGQIRTRSNHDGGITGGIANGMPIVVNVAIKPTPSIAKTQPSVNIEEMKEEILSITGRHDPCIVPRALVAVEAALAVALLDLMLVAYGVQGYAQRSG
ncbi:MAG: chorismate synthase [Firmicutes bacterium]|nr:chorismate synthase [Bacillota bacterium]